MGENWGLSPFGVGGAGTPSNTMWPRPMPTSVPSGILIHPAVWPRQTWAENWGWLYPFGEKGLYGRRHQYRLPAIT